MTALVFTLKARTFRSLRRHRNYRIFFTGQLVSLAGTWMQNVALAWLVLELSDSALAVGALAFWRFVPFTVFGLVAGVVADRFDSRRLVMATQGAAMVVSIALAAVTLTGTAKLPVVFVLAALGGITLAFDAPGRQSLTFQLVGPRELPNAVALNAGLFNGSRVLGPAIAGLIIATAGKAAAQAIRFAAESGWKPTLFVTYAASSIISLRAAGIENSKGVLTGQFVKPVGSPAFDNDPGVKQYLADYERFKPRFDKNDSLAQMGYLMADGVEPTTAPRGQGTSSSTSAASPH